MGPLFFAKTIKSVLERFKVVFFALKQTFYDSPEYVGKMHCVRLAIVKVLLHAVRTKKLDYHIWKKDIH